MNVRATCRGLIHILALIAFGCAVIGSPAAHAYCDVSRPYADPNPKVTSATGQHVGFNQFHVLDVYDYPVTVTGTVHMSGPCPSYPPIDTVQLDVSSGLPTATHPLGQSWIFTPTVTAISISQVRWTITFQRTDLDGTNSYGIVPEAWGNGYKTVDNETSANSGTTGGIFRAP